MKYAINGSLGGIRKNKLDIAVRFLLSTLKFDKHQMKPLLFATPLTK